MPFTKFSFASLASPASRQICTLWFPSARSVLVLRAKAGQWIHFATIGNLAKSKTSCPSMFVHSCNASCPTPSAGIAACIFQLLIPVSSRPRSALSVARDIQKIKFSFGRRLGAANRRSIALSTDRKRCFCRQLSNHDSQHHKQERETFDSKSRSLFVKFV